MPMKITLVQSDIAPDSPGANLARTASLIAGIGEKTDLVLLPEVFNSGFLPASAGRYAEYANDSLEWLRETAGRRGHAICSSMFVKETDNIYNRLYFVTPENEMWTYDKRHLFLNEEKEYLAPGKSRSIANWNGWRINLLICYDLRFPVWSRNRGDYDMLIYIANWPEPRREVWKTLLKARAIENQCWVAGVNRVGAEPGGAEYAGESMVVDPYGRPVLTLDPFRECTGTVEISLEQLVRFREKFQVWRDRDDFQIIT